MSAGGLRNFAHRYRILCVDDNEFGVYVNSAILRNEGYDVVSCSDAEKAAAIAKAQEQKEIDLAVLDYQMPMMNGAELAALCKAANPDTKVILYSGWLGIPKRELALADLFIQKSEGVQALLDGIEALLHQQATQPKPPAIEDNDANTRMEY
jgi:CheY-like chemotaxis protein